MGDTGPPSGAARGLEKSARSPLDDAGGEPVEEAAGHELASFADLLGLQGVPRARDHGRPIEQDASQMRVRPQNRAEKRSTAPSASGCSAR